MPKPTLKLHLYAFACTKRDGKRVPPVDPSALKVWYLARYWDQKGTGGCVWSDKKAAQILGVREVTVRQYRMRAERLGLLRVNVPHLRDTVLHRGEVYLRYASAQAVGRQYGFTTRTLLQAPLSLLRKNVTHIAVHLSTFYGQRLAYLAEAHHFRNPKNKPDPVRKRLPVLPPSRFLPRSERCVLSVPSPKGSLPGRNQVQYQTVSHIEYRARTSARQGFQLLPELRTAPVVLPGFYQYSYYRRGNITPRVLRHEYSPKNHRIYSYVNGSLTRPYGISQAWVANKLCLTQSEVSRYLKGRKKCQVREIITTTKDTLALLKRHPNYDPERPWCTVVPADENIHPLLRPGIYVLAKARTLFGYCGIREEFHDAYLLLRDGCNIYSFGDAWDVLRLPRKKRKRRGSQPPSPKGSVQNLIPSLNKEKSHSDQDTVPKLSGQSLADTLKDRTQNFAYDPLKGTGKGSAKEPVKSPAQKLEKGSAENLEKGSTKKSVKGLAVDSLKNSAYFSSKGAGSLPLKGAAPVSSKGSVGWRAACECGGAGCVRGCGRAPEI